MSVGFVTLDGADGLREQGPLFFGVSVFRGFRVYYLFRFEGQ